MKVIIVDDEPKAIELLSSYVQHFSEMELAGTFRNGLKAHAYLHTEPADLIFLDINMPHISGLSLAKIIDKNTRVIFTTAYAEHAVESYDLEAFDYLLKPISFERFARSVSRLLQEQRQQSSIPVAGEPNFLLVKSGSRTYQLSPIEVGYLEKDGNYITYHLKDQKIVARQSVSEALEGLPDYFVQVHKSYIVNIRKIEFYDKYSLSVLKQLIKISPTYSAGLFKALHKE